MLDALNGVLWCDDGQICHLVVQKRYADDHGVLIVPYGREASIQVIVEPAGWHMHVEDQEQKLLKTKTVLDALDPTDAMSEKAVGLEIQLTED